MEESLIREIALKLIEAQEKKAPITPLTEQYENITVVDAYRVQQAVVKERLAQGRKIVGKKIGLTSEAIQKMLGLTEPDYGHILDNIVFEHGTVFSCAEMISPKIESEIGLVLKRDLEGPGVTAFDVMRACEAVLPVLEIIDSRIQDWRLKIQDTVADNASCWGVVVGPTFYSPHNIDLRLMGMVTYLNGRVAANGAGAAVWGSPYRSVAWLANSLAELNTSLKAGELILSGALSVALEIKPGDTVHALFDRIGGVSAGFTA